MLEKLTNFGNSKSVARMIEIWENLRKYFEWLQSKFPESDGGFIEVQKILKLNKTVAMLHFVASIANAIVPLLVLFQG